jgi:hypothetical protein
MRLQDAAKGVGLFFLFLLLYLIISAIVAVIALYLIDNWIIRKIVDFISANKQVYEHVLRFRSRNNRRKQWSASRHSCLYGNYQKKADKTY